MYNPNQYGPQTTTQQRPQQQATTTTEARLANKPAVTGSSEMTATTESEFMLPSAANYENNAAYASYPTTKVDVRKTTISRQIEKTQRSDNTEATKESKDIDSSNANIQTEANEDSTDKRPGSYNGVTYSNGYPYNDLKTYQEYLRNFYAASRSQYQPTSTSIKTGNLSNVLS